MGVGELLARREDVFDGVSRLVTAVQRQK